MRLPHAWFLRLGRACPTLLSWPLPLRASSRVEFLNVIFSCRGSGDSFQNMRIHHYLWHFSALYKAFSNWQCFVHCDQNVIMVAMFWFSYIGSETMTRQKYLVDNCSLFLTITASMSWFVIILLFFIKFVYSYAYQHNYTLSEYKCWHNMCHRMICGLISKEEMRSIHWIYSHQQRHNKEINGFHLLCKLQSCKMEYERWTVVMCVHI
jgi:hypothetical protein